MSGERRLPVAIPYRFRLLLLVAGPLLVALAVGFGFPHGLFGGGGSAGPAELARPLEERFQQSLRDAASIAEAALRGSPRRVFLRPPEKAGSSTGWTASESSVRISITSRGPAPLSSRVPFSPPRSRRPGAYGSTVSAPGS